MRHSVAILAVVLLPYVAPAAPGQPPAPTQARADAIVSAAMDRLVKITDYHWHQGEYQRFIALSKVTIKAEPDRIASIENTAWLLRSVGKHSEADRLLQTGIEANPGTYYLVSELAFDYLSRRKDPAGSIPLYEQAIACSDCTSVVRHQLARAYELVGRKADALKQWQIAADDTSNPARGVAQRHVERLKAEVP